MRAWGLFSVDDGDVYFVDAYKDLGECRRKRARLLASHPYNAYEIRHLVVPHRRIWSSRARRRHLRAIVEAP